MENTDKQLTEKQKIFCREYIYDWNATRAYKAAYPDVKKDESANAAGSRLLTNVKVSDYIKEIQSDLEKQAGISRIMIVKELMAMAFTDIADIIQKYDEGGLESLTDLDKKAISQFKKTVSEGKEYTNTQYDIKTHDKRAAIETLNKMLGYNEPDKIDHTVTNDVLIIPDNGRG